MMLSAYESFHRYTTGINEWEHFVKESMVLSAYESFQRDINEDILHYYNVLCWLISDTIVSRFLNFIIFILYYTFYLISVVTNTGGADTDIQKNKARHTFKLLNNMWKTSTVSKQNWKSTRVVFYQVYCTDQRAGGWRTLTLANYPHSWKFFLQKIKHTFCQKKVQTKAFSKINRWIIL